MDEERQKQASDRQLQEWLQRQEDNKKGLAEYDAKHAAAVDREKTWDGIKGREGRKRVLEEARTMV